MARRSVRTVSILLASCMAASLFTGCDLRWGKKKDQQEAVEAYLSACFEFDYRKAASLVNDKDDAFQEVVLESPQRDICELVLSRAQFEVVNVDNDRALVKLTMPDIDRALKRENVPALEVEDLEDIIDDSDKLLEEEFEFDFIKDGKEWLIDPESTEDFAEFVSEIGLEIAPKLGLGTRAEDFFNALMTYLAEGNIAAAYDLLYSGYGMSGGGGYFGTDINDLLQEFYVAIFTRIDYETEVTNCTDSYVTLEVTGTRVDFASAIADVSANNAEISVPYIKQMMLLYVAAGRVRDDLYSYQNYFATEDFFYEYLQNIIDFYAACAEAGDVEPFTAEVRIDIGEDGSFSFDGDPVNDVVGDIGNPEYAFADEFYDQALDELLASGEITEEEYEELLEVDVDELVTIF